jgi:hypothetical protein
MPPHLTKTSAGVWNPEHFIGVELAKFSKGGPVSLESVGKLCKTVSCQGSGIFEAAKDEK